MSKYLLTQDTTIKHLKPLFPDAAKNTITLQEMYVNGGRNLAEEKKNRTWYKNQMMYLRQHGFVEAIKKKKNGKDVVIGLELTERGKIALGRIQGELKPLQENHTLVQKNEAQEKHEVKKTNEIPQVEVVIQVMTRLKSDNPNQKIVYDINGGTVSIQ